MKTKEIIGIVQQMHDVFLAAFAKPAVNELSCMVVDGWIDAGKGLDQIIADALHQFTWHGAPISEFAMNILEAYALVELHAKGRELDGTLKGTEPRPDSEINPVLERLTPEMNMALVGMCLGNQLYNGFLMVDSGIHPTMSVLFMESAMPLIPLGQVRLGGKVYNVHRLPDQCLTPPIITADATIPDLQGSFIQLNKEGHIHATKPRRVRTAEGRSAKGQGAGGARSKTGGRRRAES